MIEMFVGGFVFGFLFGTAITLHMLSKFNKKVLDLMIDDLAATLNIYVRWLNRRLATYVEQLEKDIE